MFVRDIDAAGLCKRMQEAIEAGLHWMTYPAGEFVSVHNQLEFFRSEDEAQEFCISNFSDRDQFTGRQIQPLYNALLERVSEDKGRDEIDYYVISHKNEVSATLNVNPDQNGLYNPDGNEFANAFIDDIDNARGKALSQESLIGLELQLSAYSIPALYDSNKEKLLQTLEGGFSYPVTFQKSIVPAQQIADYIVLEHHYPSAKSGEHHQMRELNSFLELGPALTALHQQAKNLTGNTEEHQADLMLVGRYKAKKLEFDFEGSPLVNTGYLLATAYSVTSNPEKPDYEVYINADHRKPTVVQETLFAQLNERSGTIEFIDPLRGKREIDFDFWKRDSNQIISHSLKNSFMNQDNLEYLKNALLYMGFGDRLHADLEKNIRSEAESFTLQDSRKFYNDSRIAESVLHFNRGKENEMYFFNKYDATLIKADSSSLSQTFYVNQVKIENKDQKMETRLSGFTLKEAVNLLDGRAVEKEFYSQQNQPYTAAKKIDFTTKDQHGNYAYQTYHQNYGHDVGAALAKVPLKDLERNSAKEDLIKSLKKGNLQAATALNGERVYLASNPQFKSVDVYDEEMKPVRNLAKLRKADNEKGQTTSNETSVNSSVQQANTADSTKTSPKADQVRNNNVQGNDDLLEKKDKKKASAKEKVKDEKEGDLMPKKHRNNRTGQHL